jgi:hypothetical protein
MNICIFSRGMINIAREGGLAYCLAYSFLLLHSTRFARVRRPSQRLFALHLSQKTRRMNIISHFTFYIFSTHLSYPQYILAISSITFALI